MLLDPEGGAGLARQTAVARSGALWKVFLPQGTSGWKGPAGKVGGRRGLGHAGPSRLIRHCGNWEQQTHSSSPKVSLSESWVGKVPCVIHNMHSRDGGPAPLLGQVGAPIVQELVSTDPDQGTPAAKPGKEALNLLKSSMMKLEVSAHRATWPPLEPCPGQPWAW